jgi:hypothetical protein
MIETVIQLKSAGQWLGIPVWYSNWPNWLKPALRHITPDHSSTADLIARMDQALHSRGGKRMDDAHPSACWL